MVLSINRVLHTLHGNVTGRPNRCVYNRSTLYSYAHQGGPTGPVLSQLVLLVDVCPLYNTIPVSQLKRKERLQNGGPWSFLKGHMTWA